jgi:CRP/FNR family cyclic AMP-dependent transcriptional regulator
MTQASPDLNSALRILEAQGWFAERSKATRARLAAIAKLRNFVKDERLYLAGDPANGIFGLVSGSLNISFPRGDGEDYTIHRAGAGFWIGDLALISGKPRLVSVRAAEPTVMVQLPVQDLTRIRVEPQIFADFYALAYQNFETALRVIGNLSIPSAHRRLADRLILEVDARGDANGWVALSQSEPGETAGGLPAHAAAGRAPFRQRRRAGQQLWPACAWWTATHF